MKQDVFLLTLLLCLAVNGRIEMKEEARECMIENVKYAGQYLYGAKTSLLRQPIFLLQPKVFNLDGLKWVLSRSEDDKTVFTIKNKNMNEYLCASAAYDYENRFKNHKINLKRLVLTLPSNASKKETEKILLFSID